MPAVWRLDINKQETLKRLEDFRDKLFLSYNKDYKKLYEDIVSSVILAKEKAEASHHAKCSCPCCWEIGRQLNEMKKLKEMEAKDGKD